MAAIQLCHLLERLGFTVIRFDRDLDLDLHSLNSELEQTRKGLENVTGSYLQQLAGIEIVGDIYLTELTDPGDGGK